MGTWSVGPSLSNPLIGHRAVKLADGRVLIVGGFSITAPVTAADLFDPATDTITPAASMSEPRSDVSATLLSDGTVLVAGGFSGGSAITDTAELYDATANSWTATGALNETREAHTATSLPDGTVLLTGGQGDLTAALVRSSAELYDPATGVLSLVGSLGTGRFFHTATFLPASGFVLVAGGLTAFDATALTASVEVFDPSLGTFSSLPDMASARQLHTASLLPDGSLLLFGGDAGTGPGSAERYDPALVLTPVQFVEVADPLDLDRNSHPATVLADGTVLIAGGDNADTTFYTAAEIYSLDEEAAGPVDEPEEPPTIEFSSFADFAEIPLSPGLTPIITVLPPDSLMLVSIVGMPTLLALADTELSTAQGSNYDFGSDDLNQGRSYSTLRYIEQATRGVLAIFGIRGQSFTVGAPEFTITLPMIGGVDSNGAPQTVYWVRSGPRGAVLIDVPHTGPQT